MTNRKYLLFIGLAFFTLLGCQGNQKQQELEEREQKIRQKEIEFALKEADYQSLLRMRDSLATEKDTLVIQQWPDDIAGVWSGRSLCKESNCSEYVIGDQRSNTWEFISDSTGLYTRVTNNNSEVIRVYTAHFDSTLIHLKFASDTSSAKSMDLSVELSRASASLMKGMQSIGIDKSCTAKFSVELTRSLNR